MHAYAYTNMQVFRERCPSCGREYMRTFDVTGKSSYHRHGTERTCERAACTQSELRDTIVYFGEKIYDRDLQTVSALGWGRARSLLPSSPLPLPSSPSPASPPSSSHLPGASTLG